MQQPVIMVSVFLLLLASVICNAQTGADSASIDDPLAGKPPFRRLFLDGMVVEESEGLSRIFHAPEKYKHNPIITADKPWEAAGPFVFGTVMWDGGRLKMWYECYGRAGNKRGTRSCYAESMDGINWEKPPLGIIDFEGSKANNIISDAGICGLPSVIKVPDPVSPERNWVIYSWGGDEGSQVAFSEDGLRWRWREDPKFSHLFETSDVVNFFFDPYKKQYVSTYKTMNRHHRAVGIALSGDGLTWRKPAEGAVFGVDDLDPDSTQVYGMPVFAYQGCYIGIPWMYHARYFKYGRYSPERMRDAQKGSPCTVDAQLAWSWNLMTWTRTPNREPFIPLGASDSFESCQVYTARAPVIVDDKLYFYYCGFNKLHDDNKDVKAAIGLAMLRLDGFCSMQAASEEGWLISRIEVFKTPKVMVNAKTASNGYVTAEVLDRYNNIIPGFSRDDCVPFKGDSVRSEISWKNSSFPADAVNAEKKIRFYLKNADLYSYLPADMDLQKDDGFPDY